MATKRKTEKRVQNYSGFFGEELSERVDTTLIRDHFTEEVCSQIDTTLIRDHQTEELCKKIDTHLIEPVGVEIEARRKRNSTQVGKYKGMEASSRERRNIQLWESLYPTQKKVIR